MPWSLWPLQRLQQLRVVLVPVLLLVGGHRGRPEQHRRVRRQRKAEMVASRFVRGVHACHGTTYEALREVSPLLGSRTGLSTAENPMADVAAKLAELFPSSTIAGVAGRDEIESTREQSSLDQ